MKILFICKYNRFRSKIAEEIFNKINKNKKHEAKSAGIIQGSYPLDKEEVSVAKELGITLKGKPKGLSTDILKWHDTAIIVADDVPKEILKDNKKFGKNLIVWKIKDVESKNKEEIQSIIIKIEDKVNKFVKHIIK